MRRESSPVEHLSAGKTYVPQRYVVGWNDGIVKVGSTWNGRQRWGTFLARGATMLDLAYYLPTGGDLDAEAWLQSHLEGRFARAFATKAEAAPYLGNGGAGYLECYAIPVGLWPEIIELARS